MLQPKRCPTPPGTILKEHYLEPRDISIAAFAEAVGCTRKHTSRIVNNRARIEASLATKIAVVLDTTPEFWLNLQNAYDLFQARQTMIRWRPSALFPAIA